MSKKITRGVASRIYREAAERIVTGQNWYACSAIRDAARKYDLPEYGYYLPLVAEFARKFKPKNKSVEYAWFGNTEYRKNKEARCLALLFMAETHSIR